MVQGPAQAQTPEARSAAFAALLDLLSCSLPSHKPLIAYAANVGHAVESWLTHVDRELRIPQLYGYSYPCSQRRQCRRHTSS